jgi:hypothetical protein
MKNFKNIEYALHTMFSSKFGFPEEMAIGFYRDSMLNTSNSEDIKRELQEAFGDPEFSWMEMLEHPDCEYYYAEDETDARAYAKKILWDPILGE